MKSTALYVGIFSILTVIAIYMIAYTFGFRLVDPLKKRELQNKAEQVVNIDINKTIGNEMNSLININQIDF